MNKENVIHMGFMPRYVVAKDIVDADGKVRFRRGEVVRIHLDEVCGNLQMLIRGSGEGQSIWFPVDYGYSFLRHLTEAEKARLRAEDERREEKREQERRQWQTEKASFLKSIEGKKIADLTIAEYRQAKEYEILP